MAQTLSEQILSRAAGRPVRAGEVATVAVDLVMMHDSLSPSIIRIIEDELGAGQVWDPERVAVVIDHVAPAATVQTAEKQNEVRRWAQRQGIRHFYDVGRGISHPVLVEEGVAQPGMVIVGSDSHSTAYGCVGAFGSGMGSTDIALAAATGRTWFRVPETVLVRAVGTHKGVPLRFRPGVSAKDLALRAARELRADGATYAAVEWHGVEFLTVMERMTLATLSIEVGAKAGIVPPVGIDVQAPEWLRVEEGASYSRIVEVDLDTLEPQVSAPSFVDNVSDLSDLGRVPVDVVYLGTCTNGHYEDMAAAARILKGKHVAPGVRMMVVPASRDALLRATEDGTLATLIAAGAALGTPGCGACIGRHMGVLGPGETCLFTGNRNFRGRMGSPEANIYLASAEVAAATALTGYIAHPQEIL
ncbi:3-isopropylmalate dehydratase large subunit [Chloroflexales bacterium ZM16-3]|nr:3-isopropylmalate dehydratase large subunit [Chloroflexales bacterium ZM16-3]